MINNQVQQENGHGAEKGGHQVYAIGYVTNGQEREELTQEQVEGIA
jgi:hypothetical protein